MNPETDLTKILTNAAGTAAGGISIWQLVPPKYQIPAMLGYALIMNLIGLIQKPPKKPTE